MLDDMFSFVDPLLDPILPPGEDDGFYIIAQVDVFFAPPEHPAPEQDRMAAALSDKVRAIIEGQWGKRMADIQDIYVGQFHERRMEQAEVSYRSTNRYILRAKFHYTREPRQMIFSLTG